MESINRVLFEHWDPIGVRQTNPSWPHDGYMAYIGGVPGLVQRGASNNAIAEYLCALEIGPMRVRPTSLKHRLDAVRRIRLAIQKFDETDSGDAQ